MKTSASFNKSGQVRLTVCASIKYPADLGGFLDQYEVDELMEGWGVGQLRVLHSNRTTNIRIPRIIYDLGDVKPEGEAGSGYNYNQYIGTDLTGDGSEHHTRGLRRIISIKRLQRGYGYSVLLSNDLSGVAI